ncbi:MAG TPA: glycosidase, partial [Ruminococcaceae bacterium]|nr:glycosidase [Oscillospiraceae bacterium]
SEDGVTNWQIDKWPTLEASPDYPEEAWGIEDPRITRIDELNRWAVVYTSFSRSGPTVSLALTRDFVSFEKMGSIMPPEDKDAALFPRKFKNRWMLIHRPIGPHFGNMQLGPGAHIWISCSEDLKYWGDHSILINARNGGWWDANKVGLCAQPLETPDGWLILYHGVRRTAAGSLYRLGLALLDRENPMRVLRRSDEWIFGPEERYEREGDVPDVVFPCGWVLDKANGKVRMYYGAADSCICLATASLNDLLEYIKSCPEQPPLTREK